MKPLQIEGSPDEEDLVRVQNILIQGGIPQSRVIRNGWCQYHVEEKKAYVTRDYPKPMSDAFLPLPVVQLHHPDIMVLNTKGKLALIIEIDGSAHDTRPGRKRTYNRDKDYEELGVRYDVFNKAEDPDWFEHIHDIIPEWMQTLDLE